MSLEDAEDIRRPYPWRVGRYPMLYTNARPPRTSPPIAKDIRCCRACRSGTRATSRRSARSFRRATGRPTRSGNSRRRPIARQAPAPTAFPARRRHRRQRRLDERGGVAQGLAVRRPARRARRDDRQRSSARRAAAGARTATSRCPTRRSRRRVPPSRWPPPSRCAASTIRTNTKRAWFQALAGYLASIRNSMVAWAGIGDGPPAGIDPIVTATVPEGDGQN